MIELAIGNPPRPAEVRTDATALAIDALLASVTGTAAQTWAGAAVEVAAGMWGRCLSTAAVQPAGLPIGPAWLAEVGRDLARHGQAVYLLDVAPRGALRLLRATTTDVWGDSPDPRDWWCRLTITSPRSTRTVTAPAASVVHARYATETHSPARGLAPLQYASLTGTLTGNLEQALGYEAGGFVANIVAMPEGYTTPDNLRESLRTAKGVTRLPVTTRGGHGDPGGAPAHDWKPVRLGANPPVGLVQLRQHVEASVLGCFGIPAPLSPSGLNDGTAQREAARRMWSVTIAPLADIIAAELTRVLERPVSLDFGQSSGSTDVAGRAPRGQGVDRRRHRQGGRHAPRRVVRCRPDTLDTLANDSLDAVQSWGGPHSFMADCAAGDPAALAVAADIDARAAALGASVADVIKALRAVGIRRGIPGVPQVH